MTFDPTSVEVVCVTLPKDHCIQVPWQYISVCGYRDQFCKLPTKGHWPLDDLWPHICWGLVCVTLPKDHCVQVPWKYIKVCGYSDPLCKILNQRSLTPRWPLTPHLLGSHVWLYPRIIVSKSHGNTSMYVDTVINFANYHIHTTYYVHTMYRISDHKVSLKRDKNVKFFRKGQKSIFWLKIFLDRLQKTTFFAKK